MSDPIRIGKPVDALSALERDENWPHLANTEAEAALLGAMMMHNDFISMVHTLVDAGDFYEALHGRIFEGILHLIEQGMTATPVTLRPMFEADEAMKQLGGVNYLAQLTGSGVAIVGWRDFARQIRELSKLRKVRVALLDTLRDVNDTSTYRPLPDLLARIDEATQQAIDEPGLSKIKTYDQAWDAAIQRSNEVAEGKVEPAWLISGDKNGLHDFNVILGGGMSAGDLIFIGGRPGMGKTALACTVANCASRVGLGTLFLSKEMDTGDLMRRMICDEMFDYGVNAITHDALMNGKLTRFQHSQIAEARERIGGRPLLFDDSTDSRISGVVGTIRRLKKRMEKNGQQLKLVIIDYLQLLKGDRQYDNKNNEISDITRALKLAAKDMGLAIVVLSQLSRDVEKRDNKRPMMSDLRDSGSIEQDADAIVFVYREEYYLEKQEPPTGNVKKKEEYETALQASRDRVDIYSAKVRRGKTTRRECYFFAANQAIRGSDFFKG